MAKRKILSVGECRTQLDEAIRAQGDALDRRDAAEYKRQGKIINGLMRNASCRQWMYSVKLPK